MAAFRLPEKTRVGHVVLGVTSLAESLAFWKNLLGFRAEAAEGEVTDEMVQQAVAELRGPRLADAIQEHDVVDVEES